MEKRKFPRIDLCSQNKILQLDNENELNKNLVLSRNVSATGFCFRSPKAYAEDSLLLVYLNNQIIEDLRVNKARVMKAGNYFLGRVVRSRPYKAETETFYEVGCAFVELTESSREKIELFTQLINFDTADKMTSL